MTNASYAKEGLKLSLRGRKPEAILSSVGQASCLSFLVKRDAYPIKADCFVASLLAMTGEDMASAMNHLWGSDRA
jgi:hypothetical protein